MLQVWILFKKACQIFNFIFRDDIVFFIFLYQKYIYKEDPTRVNEFGYSAEMPEDNTNPGNAVNETSVGAVEDKSEDAKKDD